MKKYAAYLFLFIIFLLLLLLFICYRTHKRSGRPYVQKHWLSWNVFFNPAPGEGQRTSDIQSFEDYLTAYVHGVDPDAILEFQLNHCPCDSLLTNIDATLITGSGSSLPPPPTKPNPLPSGDYTLANNLDVSIPDYNNADSANSLKTSFRDTTVRMIAKSATATLMARKLAVIDTGLDTLTYGNAYPLTVWNGNLLWQEAFKPTLFNVVPGELNRLMDDNPVKHGTAAISIALNQIYQNNRTLIPQIMAIRAFDSGERGSIYTVSCALSYAIEQHADYVNASWGYYGEEDAVLKYYIDKATRQNIRIMAAAGNTPGHHEGTYVCNGPDPNKQNDLSRLKTKDSLFYPACFAPLRPNLVSVTQLNQLTSSPQTSIPCYYQNYSSDYITVGIMNSLANGENCCRFSIPFLKLPIEGSSFATPVMTGIVMSSPEILGGMPVKKFIRSGLGSKQTTVPYTDQGDYFIYSMP